MEDSEVGEAIRKILGWKQDAFEYITPEETNRIKRPSKSEHPYTVIVWEKESVEDVSPTWLKVVSG